MSKSNHTPNSPTPVTNPHQTDVSPANLHPGVVQTRPEVPGAKPTAGALEKTALPIPKVLAMALTPRTRRRRSWLVLALLAVLSALAGSASADSDDLTDLDDPETELPDEPAWDPEPPVTRGAPAPAINTSTSTANGLRFAMELKVGLATKPVSINAAGSNGGKIVVFSTGRWKAAAGPEKVYAVILERLEGTRWVAVEGAKRAKVGQDRVRNEWYVNDRAQYRVTVMARRKGATGPTLRADGEVRTVIYR